MPERQDPRRVLLADDDSGFRSALREWLELDPRFVVVAESSSGSGLRDLAADARADLVVLDVVMPGGGETAAATLCDPASWTNLDMPRRPVVVALSAHTSVATVAGMVAAGATGFLAKGQAVDSLPDLLARCAAGEVVLAVPTAAEALRQALGYVLQTDWTSGSWAG